MSRSYSANQYQNAFVPQRLQNWEVPMKHRERPRTPKGQTVIISTDRGHLLDGVPRSEENPWGNFVGTWDLPNKLPGNTARITTARAGDAADRLNRESLNANNIITGQQKNDQRVQIRTEQLIRRGQGDGRRPHVRLVADRDRPGTSSKRFPKTKFPTPQDYEGLTPLDSEEPLITNNNNTVSSPPGGAKGYPEPDLSRMSPAVEPTDSPVPLPNDGPRSPTPPQRSPVHNRAGEQVPVAL